MVNSIENCGVMKLNPNDVTNRLKDGDGKICVVGLGRIGLPVAGLFANVGVEVVGVDNNLDLLESIKKIRSPFDEPGLQQLLEKAVRHGKLRVTYDLKGAASECSIIIITVSTLIDSSKKPDYKMLKDACKEISLGLRRGSLVILESTVGPGFTESVVAKILGKPSKMKAGRDFGLVFCPIRASPGQIITDLVNYPRIIGGINDDSSKMACEILSLIVKSNFIIMESLKAAEAEKNFENMYRDVNLGLTNMLARYCEKAGLDYGTIVDAANSQPFCHLLKPGIVGGSCIPVTPRFLIAEAEKLGVDMKLAKTARATNDKVPDQVVQIASKILTKQNKSLQRSKILIFGASFKANVKGDFLTPCEMIRNSLRKKRVETIFVWDPHYTGVELENRGYKPVDLEGGLEKADCIIVSVGHNEFRDVKAKVLANRFMKKMAVVDASGQNIFTSKDSTGKIICTSIGHKLP